MPKKEKLAFKKFWPWYLVLIFLLIRFIMNIEMIYLSIVFAVIYAFFFYLLITKKPYFTNLFIMFLSIDSMIGTYLALTSLGFNYIYWGTILVNFIIMFVLLRNTNKNFKK